MSYIQFLVPEDNRVRPTGDQIVHLMQALNDQQYLDRSPLTAQSPSGDEVEVSLPVTTEFSQKLDAGEWQLQTFEEPAGSSQPWLSKTAQADDASQSPPELQLLVANDYVRWESEVLERVEVEPMRCQSCSEELEYELEQYNELFRWAERIRYRCASCEQITDPSAVKQSATNPWTGEQNTVNGGFAFRFALAVVFEEIEPEDSQIRFNPAFVSLVETELGTKFVERWYLL